MQIRISFIILLGMNDSVYQFGKLKLVGFKGFVIWMSLPLVDRSFLKTYNRMEKTATIF